jgi:hypothetical protein
MVLASVTEFFPALRCEYYYCIAIHASPPNKRQKSVGTFRDTALF